MENRTSSNAGGTLSALSLWQLSKHEPCSSSALLPTESSSRRSALAWPSVMCSQMQARLGCPGRHSSCVCLDQPLGSKHTSMKGAAGRLFLHPFEHTSIQPWRGVFGYPLLYLRDPPHPQPPMKRAGSQNREGYTDGIQ